MVHPDSMNGMKAKEPLEIETGAAETLPRSIARIVNAIIWVWLWLSDVMVPTDHVEGFWIEKARQLFRFHQDFEHPQVLLGKTVFALVMWFAIDRALRRRELRAKNLPY